MDLFHVLLKKTFCNVLALQWTDISLPPANPAWFNGSASKPDDKSRAFKDSIQVGFNTCKSTEDEPTDHVQEVTALSAQKAFTVR